MKGLLFNIVEEAVIDRWGEAAWDAVLDDAEVSGAYTSLGSYPDADLLAIVGVASRRTGIAPDDLTRQLGRAAFGGLASRHPELVDHFTDTRALLAALNDVVHAEVRKLYPDSIVPDFTMLDDAGADGAADAPIRLRYESPRGLCLLAEGLVLGAADHFGERLAVTQTSCRHRGDAECILEASPLAEGAP